VKLLGRRFIDYPIRDTPGSTVQQIEHKKFGDTTDTFMSISIPLSSFLGLYVHFEDLLRPIMVFQDRYRVVQGYFMKQIVALK